MADSTADPDRTTSVNVAVEVLDGDQDPDGEDPLDPLDIVGGNGKYQWTRFPLIVLVYAGTLVIPFAMAYLTDLPDAECLAPGGVWDR